MLPAASQCKGASCCWFKTVTNWHRSNSRNYNILPSILSEVAGGTPMESISVLQFLK